MKRLLIPTGSALLLFGSNVAYAAIDLKINYAFVANSQYGNQTLQGGLDFILSGKDVIAYDTTNGGRTLMASRSSGRGYLFGPAAFNVKLHDGKVDFYGIYVSHVLHAQIRTDGRSSCSASITIRLKPGHAVFKTEVPGLIHCSVNESNSS